MRAAVTAAASFVVLDILCWTAVHAGPRAVGRLCCQNHWCHRLSQCACFLRRCRPRCMIRRHPLLPSAWAVPARACDDVAAPCCTMQSTASRACSSSSCQKLHETIADVYPLFWIVNKTLPPYLASSRAAAHAYFGQGTLSSCSKMDGPPSDPY
jgi:hypothetical protein